MEKSRFIKSSQLVSYFIELDDGVNISQRQLVNKFNLTDSHSRFVIKELVNLGFIYSKGKYGYFQNSEIVWLFTSSKFEKKIDFIENVVIFKNKRVEMTFNLFELINALSDLDSNLDQDFDLSSIITLIIKIHSQYSTYGTLDISYLISEDAYQVTQSYYKASVDLKVISFTYKVFTNSFKLNI